MHLFRILLSLAISTSSFRTASCFSMMNTNRRTYTGTCTATSPAPLRMSSTDLGSSLKPFDKKKVAVLGVGGYLGSTIYGFLQRASSIYGTGISDSSSSPRGICATAFGSESLNKILGRSFKLAFAGENFIRLTDMQDVTNIQAKLDGYDAVVLATVYQLAQKPVTANSYETSPNDKTLEFFMDDRNMVDATVAEDDLSVHLQLFQNTVQACQATSSVQHITVLHTPATTDSKPFAKILDQAGIPFTYIHPSGPLENTKFFTFEDGVVSDLNLQGFTLADGYTSRSDYAAGDWSEAFQNDIDIQGNGNEKQPVPREDLAAIAVQSLMSLDWNKSRCIDVSSKGVLVKKDPSVADDGSYVPRKIVKTDKDWFVGSETIAEKVRAIE